MSLALAAALTYALQSQPSYSSQASIWEAVKMRLPGSELFSQDEQSDIGTLSQVIRSDPLRELAVARLKTQMSNGLPHGIDGKPLPVELTVGGGRGSAVIAIGASSSEPAYTQAYLEAIINVFLEFRKNVRKEVSGDTFSSISIQVERLERELKVNQDTLLGFEQTNNLALLQEEANGAGSYLVKLQMQLADYKLQAELLGASALEPGTNGAETSLAATATGDTHSQQNANASTAERSPNSAFQELELWKLEREKLSKNLRPEHPRIVKLDAEIEQAQKLTELYRKQIRTQNLEQIAATRQSLKLKADSVKDSIREWEAIVVNANARVAEADRLKMNLARSQNLYDRLLNLLQNVDISRNIDQATLAILEHAAPAQRSYTRQVTVLSLAFVGGLSLGLGIVFLIGFRDDRFNDVVEVNATFGNAVVGMLPEMDQTDAGHLPLLELNDSRYMYAESYRSLRSALFFLPNNGERPKVLLITSSIPNEGKSTIAVNLARTLTLGGARVLLVDADLRKGRLHELLGLQCEPGLVELLSDPDRVARVIQTVSSPNFAFLSCGCSSGHTSDLFLGSSFDQVLARLRQQFDYVVIDSSPVFAADDASTLAPKVDGTLFVVRGNFSSSRQVREALELLHQRQSKILGVVFNRANTAAHSYYYYKYADYHKEDASEPQNGVAGMVNGHASKL